MTKGLTTFYLLHKTFPVKSGQTILFHAAAGGVGQIFAQWANSIGAKVIGTVGSDEKIKIAEENGYVHVINYTKDNFAKKVMEITNNEGVPAVFDGVGKNTFKGSLACLKTRGMMVSFGNASGPLDPVNVPKDIQPKVIVAENVKGLTIGEAKSYYAKITNAFEEIGYLVTSKVLRASNYGVGQGRERLIFIAVREDVAEAVGLNFMTLSSIFPEPSRETIPVKDVMIDLEYDKEEVKYLTEKFTNTAYWKQTGSIMPIDPEKVLTGGDYHPKGHHFNLKRVSQYAPAPTLTAMGSADTTAGAFHWIEPVSYTHLTLPTKRIV